MGWIIAIIVIIVILNIIALASKSDTPSNGEDINFVIDDQDPENPMFEEMQEEFLDELEDDKRC